jgi:hypothetical protein
MLKRSKSQIKYFLFLILFNIIYHINIVYAFDVITEENTTVCNFINDEWHNIIMYMDVLNCVLVPFLLMFCFSSLLIGSIFKARRRVNLSSSERENRRLRQDIKFAITLLLMNLLFILLQLPVEITSFLPNYILNDIYLLTTYIYFISYALDFYIIFLTNSLVRMHCYSLFSKRYDKAIERTHIVQAQIQAQENRRITKRNISQ